MKNVKATLCCKSWLHQASLINSQISIRIWAQHMELQISIRKLQNKGSSATCSPLFPRLISEYKVPGQAIRRGLGLGWKGWAFPEPGGQCWLLSEEGAVILTIRGSDAEELGQMQGHLGSCDREWRQHCPGWPPWRRRSGPNTMAAIWLEVAGNGQLT